MILMGISDEAGALMKIQIRATRELGWKYIEARSVEVPGFPKANIHDLPQEAFNIVGQGFGSRRLLLRFYDRQLGQENYPAFRADP